MRAELGSWEDILSTVQTRWEVESYKPTGCKMGEWAERPTDGPGWVSRAEGILALLLLAVWHPGSTLRL